MASALAPNAEAESVPSVLLRADQVPPNTVQRWLQVESKFSVYAPDVGAGVPRQGNQLTRKCCEPNGTSVTVSSELLEATGLAGGSNACVPSQPIVQLGTCLALAVNVTGVCAGSNGLAGDHC